MKKKILSMCLVVALLAIAIVGGTLAYFTDTDEATNVMTMGSVAIDQIEKERNESGELVDFTQNKPVVPAVGDPKWEDNTITVGGGNQKVFDVENVIDKFVYVKNTGKRDAYVRTIVLIEAPGYDAKDLIHINVNDTIGVTASAIATVTIDGTDYVYMTFTYTDALASDEETPVSLAQVYLDPTTTNEDVAAYGDTWEILCLSQAAQADGFEDAATALNTAFGNVNATSVADWFAE